MIEFLRLLMLEFLLAAVPVFVLRDPVVSLLAAMFRFLLA